MKAAVAGCIVTVALLAPTGWHALDADLQSDGPALRPGRTTVGARR